MMDFVLNMMDFVLKMMHFTGIGLFCVVVTLIRSVSRHGSFLARNPPFTAFSGLNSVYFDTKSTIYGLFWTEFGQSRSGMYYRILNLVYFDIRSVSRFMECPGSDLN